MANSKIERRFDKVFDSGYAKELLARYPVLANMIKREMEYSYDLGHADGYALAIYDYNEMEENNGNL